MESGLDLTPCLINRVVWKASTPLGADLRSAYAEFAAQHVG